MSRERTEVFDWMELRKENDVVIDIREFWLAEEAKVTSAEEQLKVKTAKLKTTLRKKKEVEPLGTVQIPQCLCLAPNISQHLCRLLRFEQCINTPFND